MASSLGKGCTATRGLVCRSAARASAKVASRRKHVQTAATLSSATQQLTALMSSLGRFSYVSGSRLERTSTCARMSSTAPVGACSSPPHVDGGVIAARHARRMASEAGRQETTQETRNWTVRQVALAAGAASCATGMAVSGSGGSFQQEIEDVKGFSIGGGAGGPEARSARGPEARSARGPEARGTAAGSLSFSTAVEFDTTGIDKVHVKAPMGGPEVQPGAYPNSYDVSVVALKGGRVCMEDEYFVANGGRFAAVYDGHGGRGVSSFLRDRLYKSVSRYLTDQMILENGGVAAHNGGFDRPSISSLAAALRSAFQDVEEEVLANDSLKYQGSTAVAVAVHEGDDGHRTLLSANVGDSRAVLSRRGQAIDLTRDHRPNDERERARILAMGETIEWDNLSKVHRVRSLSLSRSIGDRFANPAVIGDADIESFPIAEDSDEFIVLASDGLWDVMTSQDAVSFVNKRLQAPPKSGIILKEEMERAQYMRRKNMSRYVANEALRRGSADNICVVIVWLKDLEPSFS